MDVVMRKILAVLTREAYVRASSSPVTVFQATHHNIKGIG
jgi:hypothetical protein